MTHFLTHNEKTDYRKTPVEGSLTLSYLRIYIHTYSDTCVEYVYTAATYVQNRSAQWFVFRQLVECWANTFPLYRYCWFCEYTVLILFIERRLLFIIELDMIKKLAANVASATYILLLPLDQDYFLHDTLSIQYLFLI